MTHALEINMLLHEALETGKAIRFSYPGSDNLTAKVGQLGSSWVEVTALDTTTGKYGERWLKISLIQNAGWSQSDSLPFVKPSSVNFDLTVPLSDPLVGSHILNLQ